ncbi:hypothetical protein E0198_000651 [Clavispora lusitaniae]|nr:hypothetical protein E0198_000651 [Clavispora lusitaniae]
MRFAGCSRRFFSGSARKHLHLLNSSARPRMSLRQSLNFFDSPESKMFLQFLKSPSHLIFVASNVAILAHLQFYSTVRKKQRIEEFLLQMEELENYIDLINDLDAENEEIQRQIASLKRLQNRESSPAPFSERSRQANSEPSILAQKNDSSLATQIQHSRQFLKQRQVYVSTFSQSENIARLFPQSDSRVEEHEEHPGKLTYYSSIQSSLMALSNQLVKSFLVELNLRHSFHDFELEQALSDDSFLLHHDLFALMKNDEEKKELIAKLLALRSESQGSARNFLEKLSPDAVAEMSDNFKHSDAFKSKESRRYDFYHFKSGHYLNYENSDTVSSIQAFSSPQFLTNTVSSSEYIRRFEQIFASYETSNSPFKHMALALELAQALSSGGSSIPTYSVFRYLLDHLGNAGLYNYQSLVYDILPSFDMRQTALADSPKSSEFASRNASHFAHLIEEDPDFLGSLIAYQVPRKDVAAFRQLLKYLQVMPTQNKLRASLIPAFMKSHAEEQDLRSSEEILLPQDKTPRYISLATMASAFKACVELKQYSLLDTLINKLVYNSIETPEGTKILLSESGRSHTAEFECQDIFSEPILLSLGRAYMETKDAARAKWLLPHLNHFMSRKSSTSLLEMERNLVEMSADHRRAKTVFEKRVGKKPEPVRRPERRLNPENMRTSATKYETEAHARQSVSVMA